MARKKRPDVLMDALEAGLRNLNQELRKQAAKPVKPKPPEDDGPEELRELLRFDR